LRPVMSGAEGLTVKATRLLATPDTVNITLPVVAPGGDDNGDAGRAPCAGGAAGAPLKVTALLPCLAPKLEPAMVTFTPTAPEVRLRLVIVGGGVVVGPPFVPLPPHPATGMINQRASRDKFPWHKLGEPRRPRVRFCSRRRTSRSCWRPRLGLRLRST
jgi:hypothetical protein